MSAMKITFGRVQREAKTQQAVPIYADGELIGEIMRDMAALSPEWFTCADHPLLIDADHGTRLTEAKREIKLIARERAKGLRKTK